MNERIHILAEEAGLYCDGTPDAWDQEAIERFARLIEQDFIRRIKNKNNPGYTDIVSDGGMDPRN